MQEICGSSVESKTTLRILKESLDVVAGVTYLITVQVRFLESEIPRFLKLTLRSYKRSIWQVGFFLF